MTIINIGYSNFVHANDIAAVCDYVGREQVTEVTAWTKLCKAIVVLRNGQRIPAYVKPQTIVKRWAAALAATHDQSEFEWQPVTSLPGEPIERCLLHRDVYGDTFFFGGYESGWFWWSQYGDGSEYKEPIEDLTGLMWCRLQGPQIPRP